MLFKHHEDWNKFINFFKEYGSSDQRSFGVGYGCIAGVDAHKEDIGLRRSDDEIISSNNGYRHSNGG